MPDIFDESNVVQSTTISWGKVGDHIIGTYAGVRRNVETQYGIRSLYQIVAEKGEFHAIDENKQPLEEATVIGAGELWGVWGKDEIFNSTMDRIKVGQKLGIKFVELRKSTKGNPSKIIKVFTTGEMDTAYLESLDQSSEVLP